MKHLTQDDTDKTKALVYLFGRLANDLQKHCDEKLISDTVSGGHRVKTREYFVLAALLNGEGHMQGDVAEHLGIDRTSMVKVVDHLELRRLVTRTPKPGDRRSNNLSITDSGRQVAERAKEIVKEAERTFFKSASSELITETQEVLAALYKDTYSL